MAEQFIELLSLGSEKYLGLKVDQSHITIGAGTGKDKLAFI